MSLEDIDNLSEKELNAEGHIDDHKKIVRGLKSLKESISGFVSNSIFDSFRPNNGNRAVGKNELIVRPEDFGAIGNGTFDCGPAIQQAIDYATINGLTLYFSGVAYKTNQQLELSTTAPIKIVMEPRGKIRAGASISSILHKGSGFVSGITIIGLNLVGNRLANYCVDIEQAHLLNIDGGIWQDALLSVAEFGRLGGQVYEMKWSRTRIFGLDPSLHPTAVPSDMPSYGYRFNSNCTDSSFYKLVIKNAKNALAYDAGGGNVHEDEHLFGFPYSVTGAMSDWVADVGMVLAGSKIRTFGVYCDTQKIGIRSSGNANTIQGMLMWAPSDWANTTDVIGVDVTGSGVLINDNLFTISSSAPFQGYPIRVSATSRDIIFTNNLISGTRWLASFIFLGPQVAIMMGNRRDSGANTPEYTTNSLAIGRGNDGDIIMDWAGTNPFRITTHGSGATGYSRFRPTTSGGGIMLGDSVNKIGFHGTIPIGKQTVQGAATDAATTQALVNDLRAKLIALGLIS